MKRFRGWLLQTAGLAVVGLAGLLGPGTSALAADCQNNKPCDSPVKVSGDKNACTYEWPKKSYSVAKGSKSDLTWTLSDSNFVWDPTNGVFLEPVPGNDPDEDLEPVGASGTVFRMKSINSGAGSSKKFVINMIINYKGGAECTRVDTATYNIVLQR